MRRIAPLLLAFALAGACSDTTAIGTPGAPLAQMLNRHGVADNIVEINAAGVRIVKQAFESVGRDGFVIGDIGPFGGLMEPYGEFTEAQVRDAFTDFSAGRLGSIPAQRMAHGDLRGSSSGQALRP